MARARKVEGDTEWRPVAYERRVRGMTFMRVELLKSRWEHPWRWVIFNLAATHFQRILAHGEEATVGEAQEAAQAEFENRYQRNIIKKRARRAAGADDGA